MGSLVFGDRCCRELRGHATGVGDDADRGEKPFRGLAKQSHGVAPRGTQMRTDTARIDLDPHVRRSGSHDAWSRHKTLDPVRRADPAPSNAEGLQGFGIFIYDLDDWRQLIGFSSCRCR